MNQVRGSSVAEVVPDLRPLVEDDREFLCRLYASTRADELAPVPWSEAEKAAFLGMQFEAQHKHYMENFTAAEFWILQHDAKPIGRLYVDHRVDEIRIIDIALLPEYRQQGIGGKLLAQIIAKAEAGGLPVRIHVEKNNPALRLYRRLGFEEISDTGVYYLMERPPRAAPPRRDPGAGGQCRSTKQEDCHVR